MGEISISKYKAIQESKMTEAQVQLAVCDYIKKKYPDVIFMSDLASGMNLGKRIGGMNTRLRSSRALPDLFVAKTKEKDRSGPYPQYYHGLFIEIKRDGVRLKNGEMPRDKHTLEQAEILARLNQQGFKAVFGCGFAECVKIIDEYLKT